jgi:hypothetical protein
MKERPSQISVLLKIFSNVSFAVDLEQVRLTKIQKMLTKFIVAAVVVI